MFPLLILKNIAINEGGIYIMKHKKIINAFKDPGRKGIINIVYDLFYLLIKKREIPIHYFTRLLYKKSSSQELKSYISLKEIQGLTKHYFNTNIYEYIFEDKIIFNQVMDKLNIPNPKVIGYIVENNIYTSKKVYNFSDEFQLKEKLDELATVEGVDLFLKPNKGMNGRGCFSYSINRNNIIDYNKTVSEVYIIQEKIIQNHNLNKLNKSSINTLRFNTINNGSEPKILSTILRIGLNDKQVDNGGVFIKVDEGLLSDPAYSLLQYGGNRYYKHPDSKAIFKGFEVPDYAKAKSIVLECAKHFSGEIIGWDIAITENGPMIIEGNHNPDLGMADIAYGGLRKNRNFKRILEEM